MISKLRQQKSSLVKSVELLCDAYIDVAYYDVSAQKKQRGPIKLPATCPLLRLKGSVVVPTKELAVDRTCAYSDVTRIDRFEAYYQLAGGVNLPKVVTCVGSDGTRRKQLVKVSKRSHAPIILVMPCTARVVLKIHIKGIKRKIGPSECVFPPLSGSLPP